MAKFRKVHTTFWDDNYIEKLSAEDRYFFLFLLTNPLCTECGIYQITLKKMAYYTGYTEDAIRAILKRFSDGKRIVYDTSTEEICILHKTNYIDKFGKPVIDCLTSELKKVKNKSLITMQLKFVSRIEVRNVYEACTIRGEEEEKEEEEELVPKGTSGSEAPVDKDRDLKLYYKMIANDKDQIEEFIKTQKPKFLEPYVRLWNMMATEKGLSKVEVLNEDRRKKIVTRVNESAFDFTGVIKKVDEASDFLLLGNWFTFDWLTANGKNYVKVLEGNYDRNKHPQKQNPSTKQMVD